MAMAAWPCHFQMWLFGTGGLSRLAHDGAASASLVRAARATLTNAETLQRDAQVVARRET